MVTPLLFQNIVETMNVSAYSCDLENTITYINPAAQQLIDLRTGDGCGRRCCEPSDRAGESDETDCPLRDLFARGTTQLRRKMSFNNADRFVDIRAVVSPLNNDGEVSGALIVLDNLAEDPQVERAISKMEARFNQVAENALEWIWEVDADGVYTYASPVIKKVLGYDPSEVVGKKHFYDLFIPENRERDKKQAFETFAEKRAFREFLNQNLHKDGSVIWLSTSGVPILDKRGVLLGYRGADTDITARRRSEEKMRLLSTIVQQASEGVAASDLEGNLIFTNPAFAGMHGYSPEHLVGKHLSVFHSEDQMPAIEAANDQIRDTGEFSGEIWHSKRDGTPFPTRMHNTLLRDGEGNPVGMIGTMVDITEQKQAEEARRKLEAQIQHAQKLESLGVLCGGIAHDFNNLLTGILGNSDLALTKLTPESPACPLIEDAKKATHHLAELTNQMLAYSGKGKFVVTSLDLSRLVNEMEHLLQLSISKKAVLRYDLRGELPAVEADASQLRQIVMNLVINASEALGERSGVISLSTGMMEASDDYLEETYLNEGLPGGVYVYLEVSDTGVGMDDETVQKIFDPFFTTKFTGRGLGLAAVLGIVRGHRGAIKIYSEKDRGSTFRVLFPTTDHPVESAHQLTSAADTTLKSGTILVVDDEEIIRSIAEMILNRVGFTVVTASDGREALAVFKEHQNEITAVLLDLTMPYVDGEECFREIRNIRSDVPVILSSGYSEQEATKRFAGKGLAGFLKKPYEVNALLEKMFDALNWKNKSGSSC